MAREFFAADVESVEFIGACGEEFEQVFLVAAASIEVLIVDVYEEVLRQGIHFKCTKSNTGSSGFIPLAGSRMVGQIFS